MRVPYIKVDQPIGTFYLTAINASLLKQITEVNIRTEEGKGVQRPLKEKRLNEIRAFCREPDATFPTAIVVSVYDEKMQFVQQNEDDSFTIDETQIIGEILDGQHRLEGLAASGKMDSFELPVVLMFNMSPQEKAYIFTTINSKQTKINPSHIVDLQEYSSYRSPQKTAHTIAKALNSMPDSPFYCRLKMLGISNDKQYNATLSQGTFASQLIGLFSRNADADARALRHKEPLKDDPALPLRHYFINEEDSTMLKIIFNCFKAVSNVFVDESKDSNKSVLWKTTGYSAIIRSFPELYRLGERKGTLSVDFFTSVFEEVRDYMTANNIPLTGEQFGGGGKQVQQYLAQWIITATQKG